APPLRQKSAKGPAALTHVLDLGRVRSGVVVRRQRGVLLELRVGEWDSLSVAKALEGLQGEFLHLVGGVAGFEVRTQAVTLDGLGQDHGGLAVVLNGGLVGGIDLAIVMTSTLEVPQVGIGEIFDKFLGTWVPAEEVLSHIAA